MRKWFTILLVLAGAFAATPNDNTAQPGADIEKDLLKYLDSIESDLVACNQDIWTYAEVGLEEHRSSARLVGMLKKAGFRVKEGVAGMPTAFVAEYGSGSPVIGILAEYDALPELSQQVVGARKSVEGKTN